VCPDINGGESKLVSDVSFLNCADTVLRWDLLDWSPLADFAELRFPLKAPQMHPSTLVDSIAPTCCCRLD
jgi:hypothetical protein